LRLETDCNRKQACIGMCGRGLENSPPNLPCHSPTTAARESFSLWEKEKKVSIYSV